MVGEQQSGGSGLPAQRQQGKSSINRDSKAASGSSAEKAANPAGRITKASRQPAAAQ